MTPGTQWSLAAGDLEFTVLAQFAESMAAGLAKADGKAPFLWTAHPAAWRLEPWAPGLLEETTLEGRIFGPSGELRWRRLEVRRGACIRVVYLGQVVLPGDAPLKDQSARLGELERQPARRAVLWGKLLPGAPDGPVWIEQKIPHRLRYGFVEPEAERIALLREAWEAPDGTVQFWRFVDLVPWRPQEKEA